MGKRAVVCYTERQRIHTDAGTIGSGENIYLQVLDRNRGNCLSPYPIVCAARPCLMERVKVSRAGIDMMAQ
jgi:hypothetical protein